MSGRDLVTLSKFKHAHASAQCTLFDLVFKLGLSSFWYLSKLGQDLGTIPYVLYFSKFNHVIILTNKLRS